MARIIRIEEPLRSPATTQEFALWKLGFRPFFLLASIFAALSKLPANSEPVGIHKLVIAVRLTCINTCTARCR